MGVDPWTLEEVVAMDAGFASVWGFQESVDDLRHKLLCATLELQALRTNAKEEMRKNEEAINHLVLMLQVITHERDEARDQLQLLLHKITRPDSPLLRQTTRGSSSISESDSFSGTPNHHSSPVESFLNASASPELSSIRMANSTCNMSAPRQQSPEHDRVSAVIDGLAMKKPLPQKGKLLQAVLDAGPLLQTLLLAGPLPQWRIPPPMQQFQVPPVAAVKAHAASLLGHQIVLNPNNFPLCSPDELDHENTMKRPMTSPCGNPNTKRQKTQCTGDA